MKIVQQIKAHLDNQSALLHSIKPSIGPAFEKAVRMLYGCRGKVVITGIGKSGLVAQKISSTFTSTGTPSMYLHPAEAMHGNLGVIGKSDVVFAIGKSGESEEVLAIFPSIQKIGAKIISLTAAEKSTMAREADIALYVPILREACPLNLAPTSSSMAFLVIGDAMAISLMKLKGFKKEHFALFHPGGLLGKRLLLKVSDVMRKGKMNPVVRIDRSMEVLLKEISAKWTGAASIVDAKGKFVGLVTDFDVRKALVNKRNLLDMPIREIMNSRPTTIFEDEMAIAASEIMEKRSKPFTVLPVIDHHRKSVGMVHLHDLVIRGLVKDPSA